MSYLYLKQAKIIYQAIRLQFPGIKKLHVEHELITQQLIISFQEGTCTHEEISKYLNSFRKSENEGKKGSPGSNQRISH